MASLIVMKMTDEQKKQVKDADIKAIKCVVVRSGSGLFQGLLNIYRDPNICGTVARTEITYNDDAEAMDAIEAVVEELRSEDEPEPEPKDSTEKKPAARKKNPTKKKANAKID